MILDGDYWFHKPNKQYKKKRKKNREDYTKMNYEIRKKKEIEYLIQFQRKLNLCVCVFVCLFVCSYNVCYLY